MSPSNRGAAMLSVVVATIIALASLQVCIACDNFTHLLKVAGALISMAIYATLKKSISDVVLAFQRQVVVLNHVSLVNVDDDSSSDQLVGEKRSVPTIPTNIFYHFIVFDKPRHSTSIRADWVSKVNSHLPEDGFDYTDSRQ
jgi:hypothetical protein